MSSQNSELKIRLSNNVIYNRVFRPLVTMEMIRFCKDLIAKYMKPLQEGSPAPTNITKFYQENWTKLNYQQYAYFYDDIFYMTHNQVTDSGMFTSYFRSLIKSLSKLTVIRNGQHTTIPLIKRFTKDEFKKIYGRCFRDIAVIINDNLFFQTKHCHLLSHFSDYEDDLLQDAFHDLFIKIRTEPDMSYLDDISGETAELTKTKRNLVDERDSNSNYEQFYKICRLDFNKSYGYSFSPGAYFNTARKHRIIDETEYDFLCEKFWFFLTSEEIDKVKKATTVPIYTDEDRFRHNSEFANYVIEQRKKIEEASASLKRDEEIREIKDESCLEYVIDHPNSSSNNYMEMTVRHRNIPTQ